MSPTTQGWAPSAHAHEDVDGAAQEHSVVVTETLTAEPERPITVDRLLRQLELVRRRLAIRWWGSEGAFAGYEHLHLAEDVRVTSGVVTFTAHLVNAEHTSHSVELVAATQTGAAGSRLVLARGEGRTLQVQTSPCSSPTQEPRSASDALRGKPAELQKKDVL